MSNNSNKIDDVCVRESNEFIQNFNPETSYREIKKMGQRFGRSTGALMRNPSSQNISKTKSKEDNISYSSRSFNIEQCDCLDSSCPGCFFPCDTCGSQKCGFECRIDRKYDYKMINIEAPDSNMKNHPLLRRKKKRL